MAYLDFSFEAGAAAVELPDVRSTHATFTPREWLVIELARRDETPGPPVLSPMGRLVRFLFGTPVANALADPRLEVLRRAAGHLWHNGKTLDVARIDAMRTEGYDCAQISGLLMYIGAGRRRA